jgi:secreted Zn-dependent insulinase-like peptidase
MRQHSTVQHNTAHHITLNMHLLSCHLHCNLKTHHSHYFCNPQIKNISDLDDAEIKRVWSEIKTTGSLNFKYREQATPYELAPFIAGNMLNYPSHHIISAGYLLDDVDISQFREFVGKLLPERAITTLRSRTFDWLPDDTPNDATAPDVHTPQGVGANRKEPWYGVSYHTEAPSSTLLNTWKSHRDGSVKASDAFKQSPSSSLSLPSANPFICYELADAPLLKPTYVTTAASETALESGPEGLTGMQRVLRSKQPVAIRKLIDGENAAKSTAQGDVVWYSKDEVFSQPRSVFQCLLHTTNCGMYV